MEVIFPLTEHHLAPARTAELFADYSPSIESTGILTLRDQYDLFIGGHWVAPAAGRRFESTDPATGEVLASVAEADAQDVDRAVRAAAGAFGLWSGLAPADRGRYLFRIARILQERAREFAVLETIDGGKPIRESRDIDVPLAAAHFFYYAGWADKLPWAFPGAVAEPLGVCGQIIPWNFPLLMAAWKLAPALACGNTVVLKPAETTPLTALLLAEVLEQAELPAGVVNIVTGGPVAGAALASHPEVAKVAFTGSTAVGREIRRATAATGARLTLELGGKSAHLVFDDAPIDSAVEGVVDGIWFNQGHVCCAGSRLLLQETIADEFHDKLVGRMQRLRVGNPLDKNTDVGAINSAEQLQHITELVAAGAAEGAEVIQSRCELPAVGNWFRPTVLAGVSTAHRVAQEEIFGPVVATMTFRTEDEAFAKANATPYGLAAGVWTEKGSRILAAARSLRAGVVWANTYNRFDPASPFGGYRESGFGREGGRQGLGAYVRLDDAHSQPPWVRFLGEGGRS